MFAEKAEENDPRGYMVCDSGGKDSDIIKAIAYLSGVKFEIAHSHTTADHPLTVRYVREEQKRWQAQGIPYSIVYPTYKGKRTSMWELIPLKGAPMMQRRWCCSILKETAGTGRYIVTGVRWAESTKRKYGRAIYEVPVNSRDRIKLNNDNDARRQLTEFCLRRGKVVINPVIDWSDADVWEFHKLYHLPHNPLYDMGYRRVGCIGCPMARNAAEFEANPKFREMYVHAFQRFLNSRPDMVEHYGWKDGREMFDWWITRKAQECMDGQLNIDDYLAGLADDDDEALL